MRDLFEGSHYELARSDPDRHAFDISPDGQRIVFAFDPAAEKRAGNCFALAEIELKSRRVRELARDAAWDMGAPRYSPDGERIAFLASHQGRKHTMPAQLALWERDSGAWSVHSAEWDHEVHAPLHWEDDGQALLFTAEQKGRQHLWRFDLPDRRAEVVVQRRLGQRLRQARRHAGDAGRRGRRTRRACTRTCRARSRAASSLQRRAARRACSSARAEERWFKGALGDDGADVADLPARLRREEEATRCCTCIHGGPHTAAGDSWHYRWNTHVFAAQGYVVAASTTTARPASATPSSTASRTARASSSCRTSRPPPTVLLKKPWADARRVFAAGGSYGGYMVAWMNGHVRAGPLPGLCLPRRLLRLDGDVRRRLPTPGTQASSAPGTGTTRRRCTRRARTPSPRTMSTPTLVIHGALDYRVPDQQGLAYYNTLKARGVDARLLWFPDENHWVLKPRNSRLWYAEFLGLAEAHDPGIRTRKRADARALQVADPRIPSAPRMAPTLRRSRLC